jgi:hypothetical protein
MGRFHVGCRVARPLTSKSTSVRRLRVDTGAESTWINAVWEAIGIERRKQDLQFQSANGQIITRSVGYAVLMVESRRKWTMGQTMVVCRLPAIAK